MRTSILHVATIAGRPVRFVVPAWDGPSPAWTVVPDAFLAAGAPVEWWGSNLPGIREVSPYTTTARLDDDLTLIGPPDLAIAMIAAGEQMELVQAGTVSLFESELRTATGVLFDCLPEADRLFWVELGRAAFEDMGGAA